MRLPLISPSDLTSEQGPIYEDMRAVTETEQSERQYRKRALHIAL